MMLELKNVNSFYGESHIVFDMNLSVEEGASVCILGRNGVGKSTTMKSIVGLLNPKNGCSVNGSIMFDGHDLVGLPSHKIARLGMAYVPQGRHIFPTLTTKENLLIAERKGVDGSDHWNLDTVYELFPRLKERENSLGSKLSGGEQQMLTIARGLMQNPKMLLLDEITEGLAPSVVKELVTIVQQLQKSDVTVFLAEQSVKFALSISQYCYIIEKGTVVYSGRSDAIPKETFERYLGT